MEKKTTKKIAIKYEWILVALAALLASMPLVLSGIDGAPYQDLAFHLSRIEGIKEGLLAGKFPVMMQSVWMDGKGYPVSIFYGDTLLYFPALLRIFGIPVILAYKIFVFVLNIATACVSFLCFNKMFKSKLSAALGVCLYMTASYRFVDIYVRNAAGEYGAFLFFPVVALAIYRILEEEKPGRENYFKNSFLLAIGMTGLLETHLLSTVMTVFLLVIICLLCAKRTFRPRTLLTIIFAALETLLINLFFIVPFLDYYISEPIYGGKGGNHDFAMQIRESGAYLSQLFMFFQNPFGRNVEDLNSRMQLTVGLPLILTVIGAFLLFVTVSRIRNYKTFLLGAMSALTLWMSTNLFPWNTLEGYTRLFKFLSQVQFPWRYLAPGILFISLLFCHVFTEIMKEEGLVKKVSYILTALIILLCPVMTVAFTNQYKEGYTKVNFTDYSEVDSGYMGACEYLKNNVSLEDLSYEPQNAEFDYCKIVSYKDNKIVFDVRNGNEPHNLEVDKLNYKGYVAVTEAGEYLETFDGFNALITVIVPAGYTGTIKVFFKQPAYWLVSEIISLISLIGFVIILFSDKKLEGENSER